MRAIINELFFFFFVLFFIYKISSIIHTYTKSEIKNIFMPINSAYWFVYKKNLKYVIAFLNRDGLGKIHGKV